MPATPIVKINVFISHSKKYTMVFYIFGEYVFNFRVFHRWIECLCDPDLDLSAEYESPFQRCCSRRHPHHRMSSGCAACLRPGARSCTEILREIVRQLLPAL